MLARKNNNKHASAQSEKYLNDLSGETRKYNGDGSRETRKLANKANESAQVKMSSRNNLK